jgi:hypothetical protein
MIPRQGRDEPPKRTALEILEEIHAMNLPGGPNEMGLRIEADRHSRDF